MNAPNLGESINVIELETYFKTRGLLSPRFFATDQQLMVATNIAEEVEQASFTARVDGTSFCSPFLTLQH
jgi:hypothetical protein